MKKYLLAGLFLITAHVFQKVSAQSKHSCCSKTATVEFAMLGKNESFKSSHLSPLPFNYVPHEGKMILIKCTDGKDAAAFEVRAGQPTNNYLFVFHEWWGLNDYIKQEAERLFHELPGVNVFAIDLYDGKMATVADSASKLMQSANEDRMKTIINGALAYAGKDARVQTTGWCFGGAWSLQASILAGKQGAGCVMYYGFPEKNADRLKMLQAPVLGIFAEKDDYITPEIVKAFEKNMQQLGKPVTIKFFNAVHAFANPSNPKHDAAAAEEANKMAVKFLNKNFEK